MEEIQKREGDTLVGLRGLRVRARYVPLLKKVKCNVQWHDGPDSLPSEHNHALGKGQKKRADNKARVLTLLKECSEEAMSLKLMESEPEKKVLRIIAAR